MRRMTLSLSQCLFLTMVGGAAWAADPALEASSAPMENAARRTQAHRGPIDQLAAETRQAVAALEAEAAADPARHEELQLRIQDLKASAEPERLLLLAATCRQAGRLEEAERAEAELARLRRVAPLRQSAQPLSPEEKVTLERALGAAAPAATREAPTVMTPSSEEGGVQ